MKSTGTVLHVIRSRNDNLCQPPGKADRWTDAGRIIFPAATLVIILRSFQCLCIIMVLGYSVPLRDLWNDSFRFSKIKAKALADCSIGLPGINDRT